MLMFLLITGTVCRNKPFYFESASTGFLHRNNIINSSYFLLFGKFLCQTVLIFLHTSCHFKLLKFDNRRTRKILSNMFKVNNKNTRTTSLTSFWCFHLKLWIYFTPFNISIVNSEQVNISWNSALWSWRLQGRI